MAIITDPDDLNDGTEIDVNTGTLTITLNIAGNLDADGVTGLALYSFLKILWKGDATKPAFPFPMVPLTDESFEFIDGWDFANNPSRKLVRNAGWQVRNVAGGLTQKWAGVVSVAQAGQEIEADDQPYYYIGNAVGPVDFSRTGPINEAVQFFRDDDGDGNTAEGSDFNYSTALVIYNREQAQIYAQVDNTTIGRPVLEPIAYTFPVATSTDLNITASDVTISTTAPYTGMTITRFAVQQPVIISGVTYNFGWIINGNGGTKEQIYEFVQHQLRQSSDIDDGAGTLVGQLSDELLEFVGTTLRTKAAQNLLGGGSGVAIVNFNATDTNDLVFIDNLGAEVSYDFVAALTLQFNQNLQDDAAAEYWVYFTNPDAPTVDGDEWGTSGAILVDNALGVDMAGNVTGSATVTLDFDYDNNTQGGRTPGTPADVTVIAQGLGTAQYVRATGTILRSTTNVVSLVAPLERNFDNP